MISILPLTKEHKSAWLPLWRAYITFYESELPEEVTETTWQRFHDDNEPLYAAGAFLDGELIGITHYLFHRSTWTQNHYCYLEDLFVTPQQRGKGVAQALIRYVQSRAKERRAGRLYWSTKESNHVAQKTYNKLAKRSEFIQYRMDITE